MITKRQYKTIQFFLTRSLFLGLGVSNIFNLSKNDAWISGILGTILGIIIMSLLYYLKKNIPSHLELFNKGIIGFIAKTLLFLLATYCIHDTIIALTTMMTSFLLPLTPPIVIAIVCLIVILYGNLKGVKVFAKVAEILLPISLFIFLIKLIASLAITDYNNFLPILYNTKMGVLKSSLIFAALSVAPNFLLFSVDKVKLNYKEFLSGYILGSLTIILTLLSVTGTLGATLSRILRFPEYMALKKLRIFNFVENIENILTFTWLFDSAILSFMGAYCIKKILQNTIKNKKVSKVFYLGWLTLIMVIAVYIFGKYYSNTLVLYKYNAFILGGFIILLILSFLLLKLRKSTNSS